AFVEIMPGTEGLVHISELKHGRTEKTEDVVKKGDRVTVKLLDRDERGRLRLSMKALQPKPESDSSGASSDDALAATPRNEGEAEDQADGSERGGDRSRRPRGGRARRG